MSPRKTANTLSCSLVMYLLQKLRLTPNTLRGPLRGCSKSAYFLSNFARTPESDFYTKLKKLDVPEGKKDKLFADHVTQVCETRQRKEHKLVKRQSWGPSNDGGLRMVNQESQSKTPPQSPEDGHIYCILLIHIAICHVSENLPLRCFFLRYYEHLFLFFI